MTWFPFVTGFLFCLLCSCQGCRRTRRVATKRKVQPDEKSGETVKSRMPKENSESGRENAVIENKVMPTAVFSPATTVHEGGRTQRLWKSTEGIPSTHYTSLQMTAKKLFQHATLSSKLESNSGSGIKWYVVFVSALAVVAVGSFLLYLGCRVRHRFMKRKSQASLELQTSIENSGYQDLESKNMNKQNKDQPLARPAPHTSIKSSVYEELDSRKLNRQNKDQSSARPAPQTTIKYSVYQELDLRNMNKENKYQSLTKPKPQTTTENSVYEELVLRNLNKEKKGQSQMVNFSWTAVTGNDPTYTDLSKDRDVENKYQSLKK